MKGGVAESVFGGFGTAIVQVNIVLPGEAHAAVNLDAAIAYGAPGIAGIHFSNGDGGGDVGSVFFQSVTGIVNRGAGTFRFEIHIGALVLHGLEHADGFAELLARFCVFDGDIERALHAADQFGGEGSGGDVEGAREISGRAELFGGSVFEFDDVEFSREVHGGHGSNFQAGGCGVDDEDAAFCDHEDEAGDGGVGDEELFAGEFAIGGGELDVAQIPTGARFEDGDGSARFTAANRSEIFFLVRRRADSLQDRAGENYRGEKRSGQERAAGFFHEQHEFDFAETDTAVFFREDDAGVTLVGKLGP